MKTNAERAKAIAEKANECCHRSDDYEEAIQAFALTLLQEAYRAGQASIRKSANYHQPEDMGR